MGRHSPPPTPPPLLLLDPTVQEFTAADALTPPLQRANGSRIDCSCLPRPRLRPQDDKERAGDVSCYAFVRIITLCFSCSSITLSWKTRGEDLGAKLLRQGASPPAARETKKKESNQTADPSAAPCLCCSFRHFLVFIRQDVYRTILNNLILPGDKRGVHTGTLLINVTSRGESQLSR